MYDSSKTPGLSLEVTMWLWDTEINLCFVRVSYEFSFMICYTQDFFSEYMCTFKPILTC
jgi:hypothetical protein